MVPRGVLAMVVVVVMGLAADARAEPEHAGSIRGVIIDGRTGAPAHGATIVAPLPMGGEVVRLTDETGRFELEDLPSGDYTLAIYFEDAALRHGPVTVATGHVAEVTVAITDDAFRRTIVDVGLPQPVHFVRRSGIGGTLGVASDGSFAGEAHVALGFRAVRVTPSIGDLHGVALGLAAEYVGSIGDWFELAGGVGGGVELRAGDPRWLEARVSPAAHVLRNHGESRSGTYYGPWGRDLDVQLQLRLVRELGDARTSGIIAIGLALPLW